jgi:hypothetical protein
MLVDRNEEGHGGTPFEQAPYGAAPDMLDLAHLGTQWAWPGILHCLASVMGLLQISLAMLALSR